MSRDNASVAHMWANGVDKRYRGQNVFAENRTIFSYGRHFPMARFYGPDVVLLTSRGYSVSTSRHLKYVRRAIPAGVKVFNVVKPATGYGEALNKAEHKENLRALLDECAALVVKSRAPRLRQSTRDGLLAQAESLRKHANEYRAHFKLGGKPLENVLIAGDALARAEKREADRERRELRRRESERAERFESWKAGGDVSTAGFDNFPIVFRLVAGGRVVQSSWGAAFTAEAARRAYPRLCAIRAAGVFPYHPDVDNVDGADRCLLVGAFRVSTVGERSITAGCHNFTWEAVDDLARALGL